MPGPREPAVAGLFYPSDREECVADLRRCLDEAAPLVPKGLRAVAAVVPHAGWTYSGRTMAAALLALQGGAPETVLLFGADHHGVLRGACAVRARGSWETPLGEVAVDGELADAILAERGIPVADSEPAHAPEHSLEVILPFLRILLPESRIVPILTPPGLGAARVGEAAARAAIALRRRVVAVGSSDLTHYGARYGFLPRGLGRVAHLWSKEENDREILDRACGFDSAGVEESARRRHNACGPGAIAAVAAAARVLGATGARVLHHTTSAEVMGEEEPANWVGYGGVAYLA